MVTGRVMTTIGGLALAIASAAAPALARAATAVVPGVTVEASTTRVRWLRIVPSATVRFEIAIYVDRKVRAFSTVYYECRFAGEGANEAAVISRGVAARDSFTETENGKLVSRVHEELMDREPTDVTCRATKLDN